MNTLQPLDPISIPLSQINLIEASAGTGKTYTMGSIYLRLLLQGGENNFYRPLKVEEILVVTFTDMATQELKQKIRERINEAKRFFIHYQSLSVTERLAFLTAKKGEFLTALLARLESRLEESILRLTLAEQNMDLAAIYTIHSFCHRMLMQYAFNSGVHFNLQLVQNQQELFIRLVREFWRTEFYSQPLEIARFIQVQLGTPDKILQVLKSYIGKPLKVETAYQTLINIPLAEFLSKYVSSRQKLIWQLKQDWLANEEGIRGIIEEETKKTYKKGEKKRLKRTIFSSRNVPNWFHQIHQWAADNAEMPDCLLTYFSQQALDTLYVEDGAQPITHPIFNQIDELKQQLADTEIYKKVLIYHYLKGVNQLLFEYKANHSEKGFDDLLQLLRNALYQHNGNALAEFIRIQYPFAMIDEFQDTDACQYAIFSKIYIESVEGQSGFMMVGDPKQAIYRFRGADIFTYFNAVERASGRFNLNRNYRSQQTLVETTNQLFDFQPAPFIYSNIEFTPVLAKPDHFKFQLNDKLEPAMQVYIADEENQSFAEICAAGIYQWLQSAVENRAVFTQSNIVQKSLEAEEIAVLVRSGYEAELIKKALQKRGIASVYLSDKTNVFDTQIARELARVLLACVEPTARNILNAIATGLFGLTSKEILQTHHIEESITAEKAEKDLNQWLQVFLKCQKNWQYQGILAMLQQLFLTENILLRLMERVDGERQITDLLHLSELLQQAAMANVGQSALLRWFEKQIQGNGGEEEQIRLESERQLVKIVTIHKSKGLQYDLVWLPFLGSPAKNFKQDVQIYYNKEKNEILWDMDNQNQELIYQETFAEELRLLYVALTRAKYQTVISLPKTFSNYWNSLFYLLSQGRIGVRAEISDNQEVTVETLFKPLLAKLSKKHIQMNEASELLSLDGVLQTKMIEEPSLSAKKFVGKIEQDWQVTSFSEIEFEHRRVYSQQDYKESTADFQQVFSLVGEDELQMSDVSSVQKWDGNKHVKEYSGLTFPKGARVGTQIHRHFEKLPFYQVADKDEIRQLCLALNLDEHWIDPTRLWFQQIIDTPLFTNSEMTLAKLAPKDCIKEMPFYLSIRNYFNIKDFNEALKTYHHLPTMPLQISDMKGMVRGIIDLVFRYNGKYYLLDYKSNYLGRSIEDYQNKNLHSVMIEQHYDWQYLFYTLALHRYLMQRDPDYCYEKHFGGVLYAFLRGMNGGAGEGIFFDKPDWQLICRLEEIF
ncbi:exodeoxyribonuclease V subunit beta [Rodentibacter caecimuris]|uniref:RecBCD enzyme subunit RecB n=1 Tax=Rodentibacter caecimuris TaxID=1796644 RepID=A0ABX3KXJ6_9PAST|nr:exodeoxyribonuclease V subunit beta [Rodentibacter heylii]